jgi:broad specificity phosphatase PhoE
MTTLFLLRHGPTAAGAAGAPLGRLDWPVLAQGQERWPAIKDQLLGLDLALVLTSPLVRAREHAQDLGLPCRILPDLAEQDFGAWDGLPWEQIQGAEAFFRDPVGTAPPGGESFGQCARRAVAAAFGSLPAQGAVLVLAHAGTLRAILGRALGLPPERCLDLAWNPFGLSRLELLADERGLLRYHNLPLPWPGASGIL